MHLLASVSARSGGIAIRSRAAMQFDHRDLRFDHAVSASVSRASGSEQDSAVLCSRALFRRPVLEQRLHSRGAGGAGSDQPRRLHPARLRASLHSHRICGEPFWAGSIIIGRGTMDTQFLYDC